MRVMAWAGAALFAVALGYFTWFYLVVLGRAVEAGEASTAGAVATNVALFSVFALHHSALARTGMKRRLTAVVPPAIERAVYVWVASLLFLAVCWLWQPVAGIAWQADGPVRWVLHGLQVAGVAITLHSASRLDVWDLAGIRQATHGTAPHRAPSAASAPLEVRGAYQWVRHPIYLGWILLIFGAPTMTNGRLVWCLVSTAYLLVAIPLEEHGLRAEFGPSYRAYQQQVRWRLLPGVW